MRIVETQIRLSNWTIHVQKQVDAFKILIFWYQYQYFEILISILILILLFGRYWSWYWYWHQEKYWSWYWSWSWFFGRETIDIDIDIEIFIWKNIDLDIDPKFDIVPPLQCKASKLSWNDCSQSSLLHAVYIEQTKNGILPLLIGNRRKKCKTRQPAECCNSFGCTSSLN